MQHTFFLYVFLSLLSHDHNMKLSRYSFYEGNVVCSLKKLAACLPVSFLFQCRSCSAYWSLTFLIFSPPLQNFRVFFLTEFVSFFCLSVFYPSLLLFLCYSRQPGRKRDSRGFLLFCFAFLFVCFLFFSSKSPCGQDDRNMDVYQQKTVHRQVACRLDSN